MVKSNLFGDMFEADKRIKTTAVIKLLYIYLNLYVKTTRQQFTLNICSFSPEVTKTKRLQTPRKDISNVKVPGSKLPATSSLNRNLAQAFHGRSESGFSTTVEDFE